MPDFTLTDGQNEALNCLTHPDFTHSLTAQHTLLSGEAGTGKTTVCIELMQQYQIAGLNFMVTAMTHRAAAVMRGMLIDHHMLGVPVSTIHSMLKLVPKENHTTGGTDLVQVSMPMIDYNTILFVDEYGMADPEVHGFVMDAIETFSLKVIFIGDVNQLPPVKQTKEHELDDELKLSPVFTDERVNAFYLTEPVRANNESPITELARHFIESANLPAMNSDEITNDHGGVWFVDHNKFIGYAKHIFNQAKEFDDQAHAILLAYRNESVIEYNKIIRRHVMGDAPPFQPGEQLVVNDQVEARDKDNVKQILPNNSIVNVKSATPAELYDMPGFEVEFSMGWRVFATDDTRLLLQAKRRAKNKGRREDDWSMHFALKNKVADLRSCYAMTVHKSQSGSFKYVLMDMGDMLISGHQDMVKKLFYTGITRASKGIVLTGHQSIERDKK